MNRPVSINELPAMIFGFLRRMDEEATTWSYYKGHKYPTRLREYANHVKPNLAPDADPRRVEYEDAWTIRLSELFSSEGISAETFQRYADGKKGDLYFHVSSGDDLWIEVKSAFRYNMHPKIRSAGSSYRNSLMSMTNGAAKDFLKIRHAPAGNAGILIIGFDSPNHNLVITDEDLEKMKAKGEFHCFQWNTHYDEWPDKETAGARVRCWLWHRTRNT